MHNPFQLFVMTRKKRGFGLCVALILILSLSGFASRLPASVFPIDKVCSLLWVNDEGTTYDSAYSPANSNYVFTLSSKPELRIFSVLTKKLIFSYPLDDKNIPIVNWHPTRTGVLGLAFPDGNFFIVDLFGQKSPQNIFIGKHNGPIRQLLFNANKAQLVATLGQKDGVRIWDIDKTGNKQIAKVPGTVVGQLGTNQYSVNQHSTNHSAGLAWSLKSPLRFATLTKANQSTIYDLKGLWGPAVVFKAIDKTYAIQDFMFSLTSQNTFAILNNKQFIDLHYLNLENTFTPITRFILRFLNLENAFNPYSRYIAKSHKLYTLKWNMGNEYFIGALGLNNYVEEFNIIQRTSTLFTTPGMIFDFDFNRKLPNFTITGDAAGNAIIFDNTLKKSVYIVSTAKGQISRVQFNPQNGNEFLAVNYARTYICKTNLASN